jgi:hypothetical protein
VVDKNGLKLIKNREELDEKIRRWTRLEGFSKKSQSVKEKERMVKRSLLLTKLKDFRYFRKKLRIRLISRTYF